MDQHIGVLLNAEFFADDFFVFIEHVHNGGGVYMIVHLKVGLSVGIPAVYEIEQFMVNDESFPFFFFVGSVDGKDFETVRFKSVQ